MREETNGSDLDLGGNGPGLSGEGLNPAAVDHVMRQYIEDVEIDLGDCICELEFDWSEYLDAIDLDPSGRGLADGEWAERVDLN